MTESQTTEMAARIQTWLVELNADSIRPLVDDHAAGYFHEVLECVQAHEGSIWVKPLSEDALVIAYNDGPRPEELEGKVRMPMGEGLISKAFTEHETICHQGMFRHKDQSEEVDKQLKQLTAHQIAAPFFLFGECRGVLSAVQTYSGGADGRTQWGFDEGAVKQFATASRVMRRLVEYRLLKQLMGLQI